MGLRYYRNVFFPVGRGGTCQYLILRSQIQQYVGLQYLHTRVSMEIFLPFSFVHPSLR